MNSFLEERLDKEIARLMKNVKSYKQNPKTIFLHPKTLKELEAITDDRVDYRFKKYFKCLDFLRYKQYYYSHSRKSFSSSTFPIGGLDIVLDKTLKEGSFRIE